MGHMPLVFLFAFLLVVIVVGFAEEVHYAVVF